MNKINTPKRVLKSGAYVSGALLIILTLGTGCSKNTGDEKPPADSTAVDPIIVEEAQLFEPWRTDFKVFLEDIAEIVRNSKRPDDSQLLNSGRGLVVNGDAGRPIFVMLFALVDKDEINYALTKRFLGKIQWNAKIVGTRNDDEKATSKLVLAWPEAKGFPGSLTLNLTNDKGWEIPLPIVGLQPDDLKIGDVFEFTGELEYQTGVAVWYGVGINSGKNFFRLNVSDVQPVLKPNK